MRIFVQSGGTYAQQALLYVSTAPAFQALGSSLSLEGDVLAAGAPGDTVSGSPLQGSSFVFTRTATTWSGATRLTLADGAAGDQLGASIAQSGGRILAGAPFDDMGALIDVGSAVVFEPSGTTWTTARFTASAGGVQAAAGLGWSVALSGDSAVLGAYHDDRSGTVDRGSAAVFARSGTSWSWQADLLASDGEQLALFGESVAIDGDRILVGAMGAGAAASRPNRGAAYVFERSGTSWAERQELVASDAANSDLFGRSSALEGALAVVGAHEDDGPAGADQGGVYVFEYAGSAFAETQKLVASDAAPGDRFGVALALHQGTLAVGAHEAAAGAATLAGAVYVFERVGTSFVERQKLVASDAAAGDQLGWSVGLHGDTLVAGVPVDAVCATVRARAALEAAWHTPTAPPVTTALQEAARR